MSAYEPDTNDIRIRQLQEEINSIREEQFAKFFPTNQIGSPSALSSDLGNAPPSQGATADTPRVVKVTADTGVIDKLNYKDKSPTKDFSIGEIITGNTSGATAEIGDIDVSSSTTGTLILVPGSITGTFIDSENLNGNIGGTNIANADGTQFTTTGRGHLKARSTSIVARGATSTFELHFIDDVIANGQKMMIRPFTGQTMIVRRPTTNDGATGNVDFDQTVTVNDNQILFLQFHRGSDVTPDGGVVPVTNNVVTGGAGAGVALPIIFDVDDKGDLDGTLSVAIDLSVSTAHVTEVRLVGTTPINQTIGISGSPPDNKAILFFLRVTQDSNGGHTITLPATVDPTPTIDTSPDATTMIGFITSDNGVSFQSFTFGAGGAGDNLGNHIATQDVDFASFDAKNVDKIRFFGAGGFSFPTDSTIQGFSTSGTGIEANVPGSQQYRWYINGVLEMRLEPALLFMNNNSLDAVGGITFTAGPTFGSNILPNPAGANLIYNVGGPGAHHAFRVDNASIANFEIRSGLNKSNEDLDMVTNDIINVDVIRYAVDSGTVGFGEYGTTVDPTGNTLRHVIPVGKDFVFEVENLNPVMFIDETGAHTQANTAFVDPGFFGREFLLEAVHTLGTGGMLDGSFRLVDTGSLSEVAVKSGGQIKFLTDLFTSPATGDLLMNNFDILQVKNLDFDDPASAISGVASIGFFQNNQFIINTTSGLLYTVDSAQSHRFVAGATTIGEFRESAGRFFLDMSDKNVEDIQKINFSTTVSPSITTNEAEIFYDDSVFQAMVSNVPLNKVFEWYIGGNLSMSLADLGGFPILQDLASLNLLESGTLPTSAGQFTVSGGDVFVFSGGTPRNLSSSVTGDNLGNHIATQPLDMASNPIVNFVGWTTANSQSLLANASGLTYEVPGGDFYLWKIAGASEMTLTNGVLNMHTKRIENVEDPITLQDVATKNYVDTTASASQWSTFPAIAPVNLDANPLQNFTGWSNALSQDWIANTVGLSWFVPSGDVYLYHVAGVLKFQIASSVSDFFTQLDMNSNKIINVPTPANAGDVANKAYVDSQASGVSPGDNVTWTGNHTFNGSQFNLNSPSIIFGDSFADTVSFGAGIGTSFIPKLNDAFDLGTASLRWRTLHVNNIISNGAGNWDLNGADINDVGDIEIDGDLDHDGIRVGFYGSTPVTKQSSGGFVSSSATLQQFKDAHNVMRGSLVTLGLLAP